MGDAGAPGVAFSLTIWKSQSPFRFIHRSRVICGRGYSGSGLSGRSSEPHRVVRRAPTGCHGAGAGVTGAATVVSATTATGSGVGADLNNAGTGQADKFPYDASAYTGVTFWARAEASTNVTVVLPDKDTDAAGGICNTTVDGVCDHHYLKAFLIDDVWRRYTVLFSELVLESGGFPVPTAFAPDGIVAIQFRFNTNTVYDIWVDDVAFVR